MTAARPALRQPERALGLFALDFAVEPPKSYRLVRASELPFAERGSEEVRELHVRFLKAGLQLFGVERNFAKIAPARSRLCSEAKEDAKVSPEEFENSLSPYERAELVRGRREQAECASLGFVPLVCDGEGGYYDVLVGPERAKHQGDIPEPVEAPEEKSSEK